MVKTTTTKPPIKETKKESFKIKYYDVAATILKDYPIKTLAGSGIYYIYENGFYNPNNSVRKLEAIIQDILGEDCSNNAVREILGHIQRETFFECHNQNINYLCTKNGLLDLDNLKFIRNYGPEKFITWKIDVKYDKSISSKPIKKYVRSMVGEDDANKLQEHVGDIFANHYFTKKLVFLVGPGDSGKSTFLQILEHFLGSENCSHLTLNELGDKFTSFKIYNKRANISPDIPYRIPVKHYGRIKAFTGGDAVTLQRKGKDPFSYRSSAKLFFASNGIPTVIEESCDDAFCHRFDFIFFNNQFENKEDYIEKYTTPEMMSSFLRWVLDGFIRLKRKKWEITNAATLADVRDLFRNQQNIMTDFDYWLTDNYRSKNDSYVMRKDAFENCKEWHKTKNKAIYSYNTNFDLFCRRMYNNRCLPVMKYRPTINGEQITVFKGIEKRIEIQVIIERDEDEEDTNETSNVT